MFYEEMMIDGEWHYRTTPDGEWRKGRKSANTPAPISVERLRELLDKATPGPWVFRPSDRACDGFQYRANEIVGVVSDAGVYGKQPKPMPVADMQAAAAAVNALPALLHQLAELEAEVERLQERIAVSVEMGRELAEQHAVQRDRANQAERAREEGKRIVMAAEAMAVCVMSVDEYSRDELVRFAENLKADAAAFLAASGGDNEPR